MLKSFKGTVDKDNDFGAPFTNLLKAFDCIDYELLISELFWHEVSPSSLNLILSYLSNRTQRVKIKTSYGDKSNIKNGVPQALILKPLLFNIDLLDHFFECYNSEITTYADNTTTYSCADGIPDVIFSWFTNNHVSVNPRKCYILLGTKNPIDVLLEEVCIMSSLFEKLLAIKIGSD